MIIRRKAAALAAMSALSLAGFAAVAPAQASGVPTSAVPTHAKALGERSLAAVLTAGGVKFDSNPRDYDIVTAAVLAVLAAKPTSTVAVLTDGSVPVTAFIPNDQAFRLLVRSVTGKTIKSEAGVFKVVASLGIPTVEKILLYHVIPGATITAAQALKANGVRLTTALGSTIRVAVYRGPVISLWDKDYDARNPRVILSQTNINVGNKQIAHGINRVLRPFNLPAAH